MWPVNAKYQNNLNTHTLVSGSLNNEHNENVTVK